MNDEDRGPWQIGEMREFRPRPAPTTSADVRRDAARVLVLAAEGYAEDAAALACGRLRLATRALEAIVAESADPAAVALAREVLAALAVGD